MELLGVFANMKKQNRRSFSDFEKEFDGEVERIENLPVKKFTVAFALNFEVKEELDLRIRSNKFRIIPYDTFKQEFINFEAEIEQETDTFAKHKLEEWKNLSDGFSFFIIDIFSRNHLFAQKLASRILQCLLGLFVFSKTMTSGDQYTITGSMLKSKLVLSSFFTFEDTKQLDSGSYADKRPSYEKIDEGDFFNLGISLDYFNKMRDEALKNMLFNAFIPYYWASVDKEVDDSAFKYWTCIEQLLLKSRDTTGAELVERIKSLPIWGENRYLEFEIENLYEKRNRYAHEYRGDIHQLERNLAKTIADALIRLILIENQSFFGIRDLSAFYQLIKKDNDELRHKLHNNRQMLDEDERMADLIIKLR
jgi:hypothetical protein